MAKNKPVFQSNNNKHGNGQATKGNNKTSVSVPKKTVRGSNRGQ